MVFEEIHLIYIEEAPVRLGQEPRLEGANALRERTLQVQRPHHPVLGGAQREIHHRHGSHLAGVPLSAGALLALPVHPLRVTSIATVGHGLDVRQKGGKPPHRRGLSGPTVAQDQHAAHGRIHRHDPESELHLVLPDEGGEWVGCRHCKGSLTTVSVDTNSLVQPS